MRILLLGSNGFIGNALMKTLAAGENHTVIAFQRKPAEPSEQYPNIEYIIDDFSNIDKYFSLLGKIDVVIHAISSLLPVSPDLNGEIINVIYPTATLLNHFKNSGTHFIFLSSGGAVYEINPGVPLKEEMPLKAYNFYGLSKLQLENLFLFYEQHFNLPTTILRPSNVFGFRNKNIGVHGVISTLISNAILGNITKIWGDGNAVRDYIYIDNFTETVKEIINREITGIFNISSGNAVSVNHIISTINLYSPRECLTEYNENIYHLPESIILCNEKITGMLNIQSRPDFSEEIRRLISIYSGRM